MEQLQLLTAARVVSNSHPQVAALPHVAHKIDAFLFLAGTSHWTLESASRLGCVRVLDRLMTQEYPGLNLNGRKLRLGLATVEGEYDLQVLQWWVQTYLPGGQIPVPSTVRWAVPGDRPPREISSMACAFKFAIRHARTPVLEWLHNETRGELPRLERPVDCHDPEIVLWLREHGARLTKIRLSLHHRYKSQADFETIKQCMLYEDQADSSVELVDVEKAVAKIIERGEMESLLWLLQHRPTVFRSYHLMVAIRHNRLTVAQWLQRSFPWHFFADPARTFPKAYAAGSCYFDLALVEWVICEFNWIKQKKRLAWINDAMVFAAGSGNFELLESVCTLRMQIFPASTKGNRVCNPATMEEAAACGHLAIVQWLHDEQSVCCSARTLDRAAAGGHLDVVEWRDNHLSKGCSIEAMDAAAAHGHLKMVQWLHENNRCEGCTTSAMDLAASNGRLEMLLWLHANRAEGCTTQAMDLAAGNGHVQIVRWLHENRREACTKRALHLAASNGHMDVVHFLHSNRQEGCTYHTKENTVARGHINVFQWLHEHRPERFSHNLVKWIPRCDGSYERVLKYYALYGKRYLLGWYVDKLIECADFETVAVLIARAHANGVARLDSQYIEFY